METIKSYLKREDINWRQIRMHTAKHVYKINRLNQEPIRAFIVDDSLKHRRGCKVEAFSSHYDHTAGRHTMAQQVLGFGFATPKG